MNKLIVSAVLVSSLFGGAVAFADAAADKAQGEKLAAEATKLRKDAASNRAAAEKHLQEAGFEEERADDFTNKANKLDSEARHLLKEAAEDAEAAELWHRAGRLYYYANLNALAAHNHFDRAGRQEKTSKDVAASAQAMQKAAASEPDAKEKDRLGKEAKSLTEQAAWLDKEAQSIQAEGRGLEELARKQRADADADAAKAKQLDPKIGAQHPESHPATAHDAKTGAATPVTPGK